MTGVLDNQTLVPGIMEAIRSRILRGELPAGSRLPQADLALALRVSPVPLREALRGLEAEGLISFLPHKGAIVTPVTVSEIQEVQDLAMAIELALIPIVIKRMTKDDFHLLRALGAEMDKGAHSPDAVIEFYRVMFQPAGRPMMLRVLENLIWRTVRFFPVMQSVRVSSRRVSPTREDMIRAFESGDPGRAKQILHDFHQVRVEALMDAIRKGP